MKVWIVTFFLLLVAVAAVYVVGTVALSSTSVGGPYDIPKGRYDCFLLRGQVTVMTDGFPTPALRGGPFPMPPKADVELSTDVLGRTFTVGIYHKDLNFAKLVARESVRRIEKIAAMADTSSPTSELSIINRDAFAKPVPLSDDMYFLLKRALDVNAKTRGAFDVTVGPVRELWLAWGDRGQMPPPQQLGEAMQLVGSRNIQIDDKKRTVRFTKKGLTIDLYDMIAGFAVDQAAHQMRSETIKSGYVHCGDLWRLLDHPQAAEGQEWILGIPDPNPDHVGLVSRIFRSGPCAFVSKGNFKGYRFVGSTPISDLVDPLTGNCVGNVPVCSVIGPDATTCDAMATAFVNMGGDRVTWLLGQFNPKEDAVKPRKPATEE